MAVLLVCSPALASLSAMRGLGEAWEEGSPLSAVLTLQLDHLGEVSDTTLGVLNAWLSETRMLLTLRGSGSVPSEARIEMRGKDILRVLETPPADRQPAEEGLPLWLVAAGLPSLVRRTPSLLPALCEGLQGLEKPAGGVNVRTAGRAASSLEYTLSAEEWNGAWPGMLAVLETAMGDEPLAALFPALRALRFEGSGTLKRLLDTEGQDMGLQFEGTVLLTDGDLRKVGLILGCTARKGLYCDLQMPALRGKDSLSLRLSSSLKETGSGESLELDGRYRHLLDGNTVSGTTKLRLKSRQEEGREAVEGRLELAFEQRGTEVKKLSFDLRPDLVGEGGALQGGISVTVREADKTVLAGTLNLSAAKGSDALTAYQGGSGFKEDLGSTAASLEEVLWALLKDLPTEERMHLLHDIGREKSLAAETAPAFELPDFVARSPAADDGSFIVEEGLP